MFKDETGFYLNDVKEFHFYFERSTEDISLDHIEFYDCAQSTMRSFTVEIIDNPCTSAGVVMPGSTDAYGNTGDLI